jgi:threonine dehydrogenase-like Zn-dependent dehydrogenase
MAERMQELTFVKKGVLEWRDAAAPKLQGAEEALLRPLAVARCDLDAAIFFGRTPLQGPFAVGHEFVAEIVEVGDGVRSLRPGQKVIAPFQISCGTCAYCRRGLTGNCTSVPPGAMYGLGQSRGDWGGALSDLIRAPFAEHMLTPLPDGVSPAAVASLSDNLVDGWRTVAPHLAAAPNADVLVVGGGAWSVGLYAVAVAVALGAPRVAYADSDPQRLALAESLGAQAIPGPYPKQLGKYGITVDASADPQGLACALRSTEPEGVCTSVGIYFAEYTPVPLNEMFYSGITFKTGRAHSRAGVEPVLDLVTSGKLRPEALTTKTAQWDDAADALLDPSPKVVVVRGSSSHASDDKSPGGESDDVSGKRPVGNFRLRCGCHH